LPIIQLPYSAPSIAYEYSQYAIQGAFQRSPGSAAHAGVTLSPGTQLRVIGLFIASDVTFTAVQNETLTEYALVFQH